MAARLVAPAITSPRIFWRFPNSISRSSAKPPPHGEWLAPLSPTGPFLSRPRNRHYTKVRMGCWVSGLLRRYPFDPPALQAIPCRPLPVKATALFLNEPSQTRLEPNFRADGHSFAGHAQAGVPASIVVSALPSAASWRKSISLASMTPLA